MQLKELKEEQKQLSKTDGRVPFKFWRILRGATGNAGVDNVTRSKMQGWKTWEKVTAVS